MASNQTENFGLNQWEPGDSVIREEFNEDNQKIDAALGAMPYVKILEVVTQTAAKKVDVDVSHIDFTQYWNIELFVDGTTLDNNIWLQVNGLTSDYYSGLTSGGGSGSHPTTTLARLGGRSFA